MKSAKSRIDDLLEQSAKTASIIANASGTARKGIKKSKRFQIALIAAGYPDFANQIASCNTKNSCGSTYCPRCRALTLAHRASGPKVPDHGQCRLFQMAPPGERQDDTTSRLPHP